MVASPQSGLLAQVNSLRLPSGHSGPVLTLGNAARASLPKPLLASGGFKTKIFKLFKVGVSTDMLRF